MRDRYQDNLTRLLNALSFCQQENIRLYRLISNLFPFADEPVGAAVLEEFAEAMREVGVRSRQWGIRLVLHPDQFVVLNSERPEVIVNSLKILRTHAWIFDLLGLPRSPWSLMNIHGGKGNRSHQLIEVIQDLPEGIRLRLALENDEYTYGVEEIYAVCQATHTPMVFDAHHHAIHEHLESYDDPSVEAALAMARSTWAIADWQLVHISNGNRSFLDPQHSDYITQMPRSFRQVRWIEVEAKLKELAIAKLREEWR